MSRDAVLVEAIDGFVTEQLEAGRTPGVAISARRDGEIILERGYGAADLAAGTPMTGRTGVSIGSTTKALTCAALLQLVDAGALDLDAPIRRVLPDFRLRDEDAAARMTLRQAITHTAGLPPSRSDDPRFLFTDYAGDDASARAVAALEEVSPLWPPGQGSWVYANDGYIIAGRVIEVLSGMSYEEYMRRHIFAPLGLADVAFSVEENPDLAIAKQYDYDQNGDPYPSFLARNRGAAAAGSRLFMSAHAAGRWLQTLLDGGRFGDDRLFSDRAHAEMFTPFAHVPDTARGEEGSAVSYGLGWQIGALGGVPAHFHGGSTITMGSQFILVPAERLAIAVVANSSTEATGAVAEGVLSLLRGREPVRRFPAVDRAYQPDRARWPRLAGLYAPLAPQNSVPGPLPIVFDGERLYATTYAGDERRRPGDIYLFPTGDLEFVLFGRGRTGSRATFTIDNDEVRAVWSRVPLQKIGMHRSRN